MNYKKYFSQFSIPKSNELIGSNYSNDLIVIHRAQEGLKHQKELLGDRDVVDEMEHEINRKLDQAMNDISSCLFKNMNSCEVVKALKGMGFANTKVLTKLLESDLVPFSAIEKICKDYGLIFIPYDMSARFNAKIIKESVKNNFFGLYPYILTTIDNLSISAVFENGDTKPMFLGKYEDMYESLMIVTPLVQELSKDNRIEQAKRIENRLKRFDGDQHKKVYGVFALSNAKMLTDNKRVLVLNFEEGDSSEYAFRLFDDIEPLPVSKK